MKLFISLSLQTFIILTFDQVSQCLASKSNVKKIAEAINVIFTVYNGEKKSESLDVEEAKDEKYEVTSDAPTPYEAISPTASPIESTSCPDIPSDVYCPQHWAPYYCSNGECMYSNNCYAIAAGFNLKTECKAKCPEVDWEACAHDNDITIVCNDDCYYQNSCEVKKAGFKLSTDCTKF